jgi:hypothetical protein
MVSGGVFHLEPVYIYIVMSLSLSAKKMKNRMVGLGRGAGRVFRFGVFVCGVPEETSEPDFGVEEWALRFFQGLFSGSALAAVWEMAKEVLRSRAIFQRKDFEPRRSPRRTSETRAGGRRVA